MRDNWIDKRLNVYCSINIKNKPNTLGEAANNIPPWAYKSHHEFFYNNVSDFICIVHWAVTASS